MTLYELTPVFVLLILTGMIMGCGDQDSQLDESFRSDEESQITFFDDEDPRIIAATDEARSKVDQFISVLNNPEKSQSMFSVKIPIKDGDIEEHFWATPVRYKNGKFYATISNEPVNVTTVQFGEEVEVTKEEISDWMYIEDNKLKGGYTIRLIRKTLNKEQKVEFDRDFPYLIE